MSTFTTWNATGGAPWAMQESPTKPKQSADEVSRTSRLLIDFVSPAILQRMEDLPEHPFLHGYAQTLERPITFDAGAKRRLALYRMHLYLLMTVELPSRAMNAGNHTYRGKALAAEVEALKANT
ncbi:MAG TPA: hypothetical protein DGG94_22800 [Micromonosporaceae bacterium]|nr:hypothetical protein [Micromonosporaceae bacterium]HCU52585.1 hypothetical protein [Micromonosporaceae bacterium]